MTSQTLQLNRRRIRVRSRISGSAERPRLAVKVSGRNVTAQLIDDQSGRTLAYATTIGQKKLDPNLTKRAIAVGEQIAVAAAKHKLKRVVFDRGGRIYHGRIKALAESARAKGLEF